MGAELDTFMRGKAFVVSSQSHYFLDELADAGRPAFLEFLTSSSLSADIASQDTHRIMLVHTVLVHTVSA
jgi:hypothetical protein